MGKILNKLLPKKDTEMTHRRMKRCSASVIIRQTQIKPLGRPLLKEQKIKSVDEDAEKSEPLCTIGMNVNWYSHSGKQNGDSSKLENRTTM